MNSPYLCDLLSIEYDNRMLRDIGVCHKLEKGFPGYHYLCDKLVDSLQLIKQLDQKDAISYTKIL